jgi:hypothetical protein
MSQKSLLEYVQLFVEQKLRETQLADGTTVEWGSDKHLTELERQIAEIQHKRQKSSRGSSARADYKRVETRLRAELKSAKRHAERRLQEKEEK